MDTPETAKIPSELEKAIQENYGLTIVDAKDLYSYFGGVSEITTSDGQTYILKYFEGFDDKKLLHHDAVVAFCEFIAQNVTEFTSQKFVRTKEGNFLQHLWDDCYCHILEKQEIITKHDLTLAEQRELGRLMRIFHTKLKDFKHPGIGNTSWMTGFTKEDLTFLKRGTPEDEWKDYVKSLDYQALGLEATLIHGDWHQGNMSFTEPPFLFDLDTLSYGSRVEEIARSVTHWWTSQAKAEFVKNVIEGYEVLSSHEVKLVPKVMIQICYKKYCEFLHHGDSKNAKRYKALAGELKIAFNLI